MSNLILHCGASAVPRSALDRVHTPAATRSWKPIPHDHFLAQIESALPRHGLTVAEEAHGLTHDGSRYFALLQIRNGQEHPDYSRVLGLRNAHDKAFSAGVVIGATVMVCDNLSFSGQIQVSRKHTTFVLRDLPSLIDQAIAQLTARWHDQDRRIDAYKACRLSDAEAHDLVIRSLDEKVVCGSEIPKVIQEYRSPSHDAFQPRNTWSLFNAFTEICKGRLHDLPRRTQALHRLCDEFVGLN